MVFLLCEQIGCEQIGKNGTALALHGSDMVVSPWHEVPGKPCMSIFSTGGGASPASDLYHRMVHPFAPPCDHL